MLQYATITNQGDRSVNEDSCAVVSGKNNSNLLLLADGLGGHGHGDEASQIAISMAKMVFEESTNEDLPNKIPEMFNSVQQALIARQIQQNCKNSMKTTMNVVLVVDDMLYQGHVGDSRTYIFRNNRLLQHTKDHSVPQMLVSTGEIREKDIRHHPDRNRLLRVLGTEGEAPRFEMESPLALQLADAVLLCSDGFWEYISEREMQHTLKQAKGDPQNWLQRMDVLVQKHGMHEHMDNNTAIAAIFS